jgi:hypothetical protein
MPPAPFDRQQAERESENHRERHREIVGIRGQRGVVARDPLAARIESSGRVVGHRVDGRERAAPDHGGDQRAEAPLGVDDVRDEQEDHDALAEEVDERADASPRPESRGNRQDRERGQHEDPAHGRRLHGERPRTHRAVQHVGNHRERHRELRQHQRLERRKQVLRRDEEDEREQQEPGERHRLACRLGPAPGSREPRRARRARVSVDRELTGHGRLPRVRAHAAASIATPSRTSTMR